MRLVATLAVLEELPASAKDGRFLGLRTDVTEAGTPIASQIEVVTGWFAELQQRVPSR